MLEKETLAELSAQPGDTLLMPLSRRLSGADVDTLVRYAGQGGKVVILPGRGAADHSAGELFDALGLPVAGVQFAARELSIRWGDSPVESAAPDEERLPAGSPVLIFEPRPGQQVLARFSKNHAAVLASPQGVVINWPVEPGPLTGNSIRAFESILGKATPGRQASMAAKLPLALLPPNPAKPLLDKQPEKIAPVPASNILREMTPVEKALAPVEPAAKIPQPPAPVAVQTPVTPPAQKSPLLSQPTFQTVSPVETPAQVAETSDGKRNEGPRNLAESITDADNENVFTDIPEEEGGEVQMGDDGTFSASKSRTQKTVSFLGGGDSPQYNNFDYGEYYQKMQSLSTLRERVEQGLELANLFQTDVAESAVLDMMIKASRSKSRFESLFLASQTEQAQKAFNEAQNLLVQAVAMTSPPSRVEGRAIWLDRGTIVASGSPEGLKRHLQKLRNAGINIIYFETLNAGFPIYPSKHLRANPLIHGWDPLKVAVEEGHRLGIEVHAWVWCFAVGNMRHNVLIDKPDNYAGPVLVDAGMMGESLRNAEGGLMAGSRQHEFWLSPASPRARQFLINVYREIVSNYDVDGLQLDYIRYPFQGYRSQMGFEAAGREKFQASTGLTLGSLDDNAHKMWIAWKTYQVNSFVKEVSQTLKGIKPDLKLSAAVFPLTRANRILAIQQDWETWVDNGWIDTLSPMSYTSSPKRLQRIFEYVTNATEKRIPVYPGIAINKLDPVQLVMQLEALRDVGSLGSTLFAMAHFSDEKAGILGEGPYKTASPLSPHHDPLGGLEIVLAEYREKFGKLRQQTDKPVPEDALKSISQQLQDLGSGLVLVRSEAGKGIISDILLQSLRSQLHSLETTTRQWAEAEPPAQVFRAQYFGRLVVMMRQLADYLSGQPNLYHSNPTALRNPDNAG